ncbi:hypothetical protein [Streptomyces inhibens]|uniref:hypothetical protein n=1 Tax=Streptomyces inhibens TaxID=2293571 RepID=UPI001EE6A257|nr:hypothetical protein [Streptomyces inhibens]UKY47442.1 hypothetical protein KI385_00315 [Streptomyces inhibens]
MVETLEWLVESCERTAEAPDLLPDDCLAEPEPAVARRSIRTHHRRCSRFPP